MAPVRERALCHSTPRASPSVSSPISLASPVTALPAIPLIASAPFAAACHRNLRCHRPLLDALARMTRSDLMPTPAFPMARNLTTSSSKPPNSAKRKRTLKPLTQLRRSTRRSAVPFPALAPPKRPRSSYIHFYMEFSRRAPFQHIEMLELRGASYIATLARLASDEWHQMNLNDRMPFKSLWVDEKVEYFDRMGKYVDSLRPEHIALLRRHRRLLKKLDSERKVPASPHPLSAACPDRDSLSLLGARSGSTAPKVAAPQQPFTARTVATRSTHRGVRRDRRV
ncbi:hypothetical protein DFJ73DRAFT_840668 [Zopfochytrium polystomum]|nr:hypothetical protein DFJ73DRAFT_840668 [Zopfochytrium polystomum]